MQEPSFDNWTIIFVNFSFVGFLLFFFFWFRPSQNQIANRLIAIYVLLYAIMMVEYVLYWTRYLYYLPHFTDISAGFPFALGPLLYLYLKITFEKYKLSTKDILHFLPLIFFLFYKAPFYALAGLDKIQSPYPFVFNGYWKIAKLMPWVKILHNCIYAIIIFAFIKRQSNVAQVKKWAYMLLLFFTLFIISGIAYYILVLLPWFNTEWDYFISFIMSAGILCTAWFVLAYPSIFSGFGLKEAVLDLKNNNKIWQQTQYIYKIEGEQGTTIPINYNYKQELIIGNKTEVQVTEPKEAFVKYKNSGLTNAAANELLEMLKKCMRDEKIYREGDINLEDLAKKLGTTKHNLSQIINERLGMNFFDYINLLRIEEAMKLLKSNNKQQLTIIEIAYDVGFNNKVTFNTAFKKITGQTPGEFRKIK